LGGLDLLNESLTVGGEKGIQVVRQSGHLIDETLIPSGVD
jgi:hypothetical protein